MPSNAIEHSDLSLLHSLSDENWQKPNDQCKYSCKPRGFYGRTAADMAPGWHSACDMNHMQWLFPAPDKDCMSVAKVWGLHHPPVPQGLPGILSLSWRQYSILSNGKKAASQKISKLSSHLIRRLGLEGWDAGVFPHPSCRLVVSSRGHQGCLKGTKQCDLFRVVFW